MKKLIENFLKDKKKLRLWDLTLARKKVAILSDLHLGSGWANDDSLKNNLFMFEALKYYYDNDYLVVLDGDIFDIAENRDIELIKAAHEDIVWLMGELYKDGRLVYVRGNHDDFIKEKQLATRISTYTKKEVDFLPGIKIFDEVDIWYHDADNEFADKDGYVKYAIVHGHQESFFYRYFNRIVCFMVGMWGKLKKWAAKDPTGVLGSLKDFTKTIDEYEEVAKEEGFVFICGHTHSVVFNRKRYYNVGAGVMPRCITCGELIDGKYIPYKWSYVVKDKKVYVDKTELK